MQITPPFGFKEIVPLQRQSMVRLPAAGELPPFATLTNAIPLSFTEFAAACRDYPIVFTSGDNGATYMPVAIVGTARGENVFVRDGQWDPAVYLPAYVRRYPFCMTRVQIDKVEQPQRLICIEKEAIVESGGERLFDEEGKPSERWTAIEKLLNEYESDLDRTREMCGILAGHKLLDAFGLQANLPAGNVSLTGMARVDERKLMELEASTLRDLLQKGIVARIYAHLLSLENFPRVIARGANAEGAAGGQAAG